MPPRRRLPSTSEQESLTLEELRALRMRAQCLAPRRPRRSLVQVVKVLCGVNAQLPSAMMLSLRARVDGLTAEDIETLRVRDRTLVRTWCMRGTLHLVSANDIDWLLSAIAPAEVEAGWRWLDRRGGLTRPDAERVLDQAVRTLKVKGSLTRGELFAAVSDELGLEVKHAAAGVVHLNGMLGRVCFGPDRGSQPTYVALGNWLGRKIRLSARPDYTELARRYLLGYGPASPDDFAAWWSLPLTVAKRAWTELSGQLHTVKAAGQAVSMLAPLAPADARPAQPDPVVRLIPAFDTYLLGYHARDFAVAPEFRKRVFHGGAIVPTVLVDGRAAGTWRYEKHAKQIRVHVTPFTSFASTIRERIVEEGDDIGWFFGLTASITFGKEG